jgi:hypothetical protein
MNHTEYNKVLDLCLDRINHGAAVEACLADYPKYAQELRPQLEAAASISRSAHFKPSDDARRQARKRLFDAIERRQKPSVWGWITARAPAWGTVVSVLLVLAIGLVGFNAVPGSIPTIVATTPTPVIINGVPQPVSSNFQFMVSDAPNDIGDFTSLIVTVDRVEMLKQSGGDANVTFIPGITDFDLTKLIGTASQQLWQGNVPEGAYTRVDIVVSAVKGTLKTGETVDVKLPSGRLQISIPFVVGADKVTTFTFDITVNKTGQGSANYILKPQAGESGATYQSK